MNAHLFQYQCIAETHTGNVRPLNEDAFLESTDQGLWVVADGMGGHQAGDVASQLIVHHLKDFNAGRHLGKNVQELYNRIYQANNELIALAEDRHAELIGSTVVALQITGHYGACAWLGDSRLYLLRNRRLKQITRDHTLANEFEEAQNLYDEDSYIIADGNAITRAVGGYPELNIDFQMMEILPEDIFLLCTDGFTREITDEEMESGLEKASLENNIRALMKTALGREARDNITVVAVKVARQDSKSKPFSD